ncbi:hypothetical protein [Paenibacillus sp. GCM10012306]|uniref:hypothetical protein n=1 Tax=Paenibacillus sp. GCM10012306 TaxID=3317342 RepID=UPI003622FF8D
MEYNAQSKPESPDTELEEVFSNQQSHEIQEPYHYQEMKQNFKHSGPGIASFVISMVTVLGYVIAFVIVGAMASTVFDQSGNLLADASQLIITVGFSVLILSALNVIGVIVGIIGLVLRNRRKVLGIIGTIINGVIVLLFMLLISTVFVNAGGL